MRSEPEVGETKTCPFCGAEKGEGILHEERSMIPLPELIWFKCGTILNIVRGPKCYETEIANLKEASQ